MFRMSESEKKMRAHIEPSNSSDTKCTETRPKNIFAVVVVAVCSGCNNDNNNANDIYRADRLCLYCL